MGRNVTVGEEDGRLLGVELGEPVIVTVGERVFPVNVAKMTTFVTAIHKRTIRLDAYIA